MLQKFNQITSKIVVCMLSAVIWTLINLMPLAAQTETMLKAGIGFPMGDFSEGTFSRTLATDKINAAAPGISVGVMMMKEVGTNLYAFGQVDFFYNGLDGEYRDDAEEYLENMAADYELELPKHINIPLSMGVAYRVDMSAAELYIMGGMNFHIYKLTRFDIYYVNEYEVTGSVQYGWSYQLGFFLSAMYSLNENVFITLDYFPEVRPKVTMEGEITVYDYFNDEIYYEDELNRKMRMPVELFRFGLGWRF